MTEFDAFEQKLADSLQSGEMPPEDFTARVMAQVAKTPQVKAGSSKRTWKIVLTAAACLAVVCVAVPVVFFGTMRAGSAAPQAADGAAPAEAPAAMEPSEAEAACEEEAAEVGAVNGFSVTADSAAEEEVFEFDVEASQKAKVPTGYSSIDDVALCRRVREVLNEMGIAGDGETYFLTTEQAAVLQETLPELELPESDLTLVLEG